MQKRVDSQGIAMLHDRDNCTGCFGCESACRETNRYSYDEDWMLTVRCKPILVDGKLRQYHTIAPLLDKCAQCMQKNPEPLCASGCSAGALFIGTFEEIIEMAKGRHCAIFTA